MTDLEFLLKIKHGVLKFGHIEGAYLEQAKTMQEKGLLRHEAAIGWCITSDGEALLNTTR